MEAHIETSIVQIGTIKVDVLFVIDNSNSMREEQETLANQVVSMVQELINPSDEDTSAVEDLHIGIITTDVGTGGYPVDTCENSQVGDDGELQNVGRLDHDKANCRDQTYSAADCTHDECPWLIHNETHSGTEPAGDEIWAQFGCIATLGTGGCGYEQPLESSLRALSTKLEPGQHNAGFVREDSLLAIIYVTDEDDCSAKNNELFNQSNSIFGGINTRCVISADTQLHNVRDRYYNGLVGPGGVRANDPDRIVVAGIVGIPTDTTVWKPGDDFEDLKKLQTLQDEENLNPVCSNSHSKAFPAVRIVDFVNMFEENGVLASICHTDWTPALTAITDKILVKVQGSECLKRAPASTDHGVCQVVEILSTDSNCPHLHDPSDPTLNARDIGFNDRSADSGWQADDGLTAADDESLELRFRGKRRCVILPSDYDGNYCPDRIDGTSDTGACPEDLSGRIPGWYFDSTNCANGQIRFTSPDITSDGSLIHFACLTSKH